MNARLSHVIAAVYDKPWFIRDSYLATMNELIRLHVEGGRLSHEEIQERLDSAAAAAGPRRGARTIGAVGVIPVYGSIFPRANLMTEMSGGTTISGLRAAFREALEDETIGSILFDVDSPGGYVDGVEELASEIRAARGQKTMVASVDYQMASAALYLMSGVDEIAASPSSEVGWIGTVAVHQEISKANEAEGITTTIIRNPAGKYGGNPYEPLSEQAFNEIKAIIDERTAQFETAVAKGRGVSLAKVRSDFGQGGGMSASRAKAVDLVDRVESFDETVRRLATGKGPAPRGSSAGVDRIPVQGGDPTPGDDPDVDATGEPGTPPARSRDAEAALAIARAKIGR